MSIKNGQLNQERREFLQRAGSLAVMGMFGISFFTSCADDDPNPGNVITSPGNTEGIDINGNTITINTDIITTLNNVGGWMLIVPAQTLVVNDGQVRALTSVCTHSQCDRSWNFGSNVFTCTCHGSRFNTTGQVLQGPANQPLTQFGVQVSGNSIIITK
mgnify:CR=1 FL=1